MVFYEQLENLGDTNPSELSDMEYAVYLCHKEFKGGKDMMKTFQYEDFLKDIADKSGVEAEELRNILNFQHQAERVWTKTWNVNPEDVFKYNKERGDTTQIMENWEDTVEKIRKEMQL